MVKIINNADDFGYSRAVNYAIIDSHILGALTSTTLMSNMPGFSHAAELAKRTPTLGVGVHLTLTCGFPVLKTHTTLIEEDGSFKKRSFYLDESTSISEEEVYLEWKAQIEKVLEAGIKPTHFDSHHHSHTYKSNLNVLKRLSEEYQLPVRNPYTVNLQEQNRDHEVVYGISDIGSLDYRDKGFVCNDILIDPWSARPSMDSVDKNNLAEKVIKIVEANKELSVIEIMWHPAYVDRSLYEGSAFHLARMYECEALIDQQLISYFKQNTQLCTYRDI